MKTFPGEGAAWVDKAAREAGEVGERWHVYIVLKDASRRLEHWIEQALHTALGALAPESAGALSVVDRRFRHITIQMVSLPAQTIGRGQIAAFCADLAEQLARVEAFLLRMRWPVAATGSLEGDVLDPDPRQPSRAVSDLVRACILKHFGPERAVCDIVSGLSSSDRVALAGVGCPEGLGMLGWARGRTQGLSE